MPNQTMGRPVRACLTHNKTTRNSERYGLLEGEEDPGVNSIYLLKSVTGPNPPRQVNVTVEAATTFDKQGLPGHGGPPE